MKNCNDTWFTAFRYSAYVLAIIGYLLYLAYLMYQLATDYPFLNVRYNFLDTMDVPIIEMCGSGYFEVLRCDLKSNDFTNTRDGCTNYVSNVIYGTDNNRKYCRTFKANGMKFINENPDGLSKLKFYFNINRTEAEEGALALGVALLNINFLPTDFDPKIKMDRAVQVRRQLQGNFAPAVIDNVTLMKLRTEIYKSILPWDFGAIFGLNPKYHITQNIECLVNYFPFNQQPYDTPSGTNGYFSVSASDFIMEETIEKRSTTILSTVASAGGALGITGSILWFLFGSTRLNTYGFARRVKWYFTNEPKETEAMIDSQIFKILNAYLDLSSLKYLNEKNSLNEKA